MEEKQTKLSFYSNAVMRYSALVGNTAVTRVPTRAPYPEVVCTSGGPSGEATAVGALDASAPRALPAA